MFCKIKYIVFKIKILTVLLLSRSFGKVNLINNQPDVDKVYLYAKNPYEAKYLYLIKKREKVGLDHFEDSKVFIEYSSDTQDVYKNIEDYNPDKKT